MAALKKFNSYMGGFYFSLTRADSRQAMRFLSKKSNTLRKQKTENSVDRNFFLFYNYFIKESANEWGGVKFPVLSKSKN